MRTRVRIKPSSFSFVEYSRANYPTSSILGNRGSDKWETDIPEVETVETIPL